jgi:hypothetical protein
MLIELPHENGWPKEVRNWHEYAAVIPRQVSALGSVRSDVTLRAKPRSRAAFQNRTESLPTFPLPLSPIGVSIQWEKCHCLPALCRNERSKGDIFQIKISSGINPIRIPRHFSEKNYHMPKFMPRIQQWFNCLFRRRVHCFKALFINDCDLSVSNTVKPM